MKRHKTEMKIRWFQGTLPCTGQGTAEQMAEIFGDSWSSSSDGLNLSSKVLNLINSKHYNPLLRFAVLYLPKHVTTPGAEMSNAYNFQQKLLLDISLQQYSPNLLTFIHCYSQLLPSTLGNIDEHLQWNMNMVQILRSTTIKKFIIFLCYQMHHVRQLFSVQCDCGYMLT